MEEMKKSLAIPPRTKSSNVIRFTVESQREELEELAIYITDTKVRTIASGTLCAGIRG
jgi:hypothetical protein